MALIDKKMAVVFIAAQDKTDKEIRDSRGNKIRPTHHRNQERHGCRIDRFRERLHHG